MLLSLFLEKVGDLREIKSQVPTVALDWKVRMGHPVVNRADWHLDPRRQLLQGQQVIPAARALFISIIRHGLCSLSFCGSKETPRFDM
jgi:hypothetical protein